MARRQAEEKPQTVTLVSPDGSQTREVTVGSEQEVKARWDGYLPAEQQKLEPTPVEVDSVEHTVGTNA